MMLALALLAVGCGARLDESDAQPAGPLDTGPGAGADGGLDLGGGGEPLPDLGPPPENCGDGECRPEEGEDGARCAADCAAGLPNDGCDSATLLDPAAAPLTVRGSTRGARADLPASCGVQPSSSPDVFYAFALDSAARVRVHVTADPQRWDTFLYLLTGGCSADAEVVVCNDDSPEMGESEVEAVLEPGKYRIMVAGFDGPARGPFELTFVVEPFHPVCGNGECEPGEDRERCSVDCSLICGDELCEPAESWLSCPLDCPSPCGDGECDPAEAESWFTCPEDCPNPCGDGQCVEVQGESWMTCPDDCPPPDPPPNDGCAGAAALDASGEGQAQGTTLGAVADLDRSRGPDVFYTFTLAAERAVAATVQTNFTWDSRLDLFVGGCDALAPLADSVSQGAQGAAESRVALGALGPGTYHLVVSGRLQGDFGGYTLTLSVGEAVSCGDGVCAPAFEDYSACPADCADPCGDGECDLLGGEDPISCPADCQDPCGDGLCDGARAEDWQSCPADCEAPDPPPNDLCQQAVPVTPEGHQEFDGSTAGAGTEFQEERGADVFYRFVLQQRTRVQVLMESAPPWDTFLYLARGPCGALQEVAANDDSGVEGASRIDAYVEAGEYHVVATGFWGLRCGPFHLSMDFDPLPPRPPNDTCAQARNLRPGLGQLQAHGTTAGGAPDYAGSFRESPDVFYAIEVAAEYGLRVLVEAEGWDPALYLLSGPCEALAPVADNDDCDGDDRRACVTLPRLDPGLYPLVVTGFGPTHAGEFRLQVDTEPPP